MVELKVHGQRLTHHQMRFVEAILRGGGSILYPTDSSYAVGGDWANPRVRSLVLDLKGRPSTKFLPVIVDSLTMAKAHCQFTPCALYLARALWPGPLTIVLPLLQPVGDQKTLAVRVPQATVARQLARGLRRPLISTSANRSGAPACYTVNAFIKQIRRQGRLPDVVINAGPLSRRKVSTIVDCSQTLVQILRIGPIPKSAITKICANH